jgi:hypothetical protein
MFRQATGDFVLTGNITVTNRAGNNIPAPSYSLGGLMIRNPKNFNNGSAGWTPGQEDYIFLSIGNGSQYHPSCPGCPTPHFEVKSTDNSTSVLNLSPVDTNTVDIRLVRLHPFVLVLYRYPNQSWIVHRRYERDDLQDTLQAGMVTYTDWDKVSTYSDVFHNSHVLNEALDPDPSNNPWVPFAPDISTRYDYLDLQSTTFPPAWVGLDLTDVMQVSDQVILDIFGDPVIIPPPVSGQVWFGRINSDWNNGSNWLAGVSPMNNDTVVINSCDCPQASCVTIMSGDTISIAGLSLREGAILTVEVGALVSISGPVSNEGVIVIEGELNIMPDSSAPVNNYGTLDCRAGGSLRINGE